jgi:hypothetical protein
MIYPCQDVGGVLRKGDEGLNFYFLFFKKVFFWARRGGWAISTPF